MSGWSTLRYFMGIQCILNQSAMLRLPQQRNDVCILSIPCLILISILQKKKGGRQKQNTGYCNLKSCRLRKPMHRYPRLHGNSTLFIYFLLLLLLLLLFVLVLFVYFLCLFVCFHSGSVQVKVLYITRVPLLELKCLCGMCSTF